MGNIVFSIYIELVYRYDEHVKLNTFTNRELKRTCRSQTISGFGNPVALQTNLTVDPFRTVIFRPGLSIEITGGTETVGGDKNFEMAYITTSKF